MCKFSFIKMDSHAQPETILQKPLSPILSNTKINKRILFDRKLLKKKNKINLLEKFHDLSCNEMIGRSKVEQLDELEKYKLQHHTFAESLAVIQPQCNVGKYSAEQEIPDDTINQSPESAVPNLTRQFDTSDHCLSNFKLENLHSNGFYTASGQDIVISKKASVFSNKLFPELLNSTVTKKWNKKYSFLGRSGISSAIVERNKDYSLVSYDKKNETSKLDVIGECSNSQNKSTTNSQEDIFYGFELDEYNQSKMKFLNILKVIKSMEKSVKRRQSKNSDTPIPKRIKLSDNELHLYLPDTDHFQINSSQVSSNISQHCDKSDNSACEFLTKHDLREDELSHNLLIVDQNLEKFCNFPNFNPSTSDNFNVPTKEIFPISDMQDLNQIVYNKDVEKYKHPSYMNLSGQASSKEHSQNKVNGINCLNEPTNDNSFIIDRFPSCEHSAAGFATASGKTIKISNTGFQRMNQIIARIDREEKCETEHTSMNWNEKSETYKSNILKNRDVKSKSVADEPTYSRKDYSSKCSPNEKCIKEHSCADKHVSIASENDIKFQHRNIYKENQMNTENPSNFETKLEFKKVCSHKIEIGNSFNGVIPIIDSKSPLRNDMKTIIHNGLDERFSALGNNLLTGFTTGSGNAIKISSSNFHKSNHLFENVDKELVQLNFTSGNLDKDCGKSNVASIKLEDNNNSSPVVIPPSSSKTDIQIEDFGGFNSEAGFDMSSVQKSVLTVPGFSTASRNTIPILNSDHISTDFTHELTSTDFNQNINNSNIFHLNLSNVTKIPVTIRNDNPGPRKRLKTLGTPLTKTIKTKDDYMQRGRALFQDMEFTDLKLNQDFKSCYKPSSNQKFLHSTPVKSNSHIFSTFSKNSMTPVKHEQRYSMNKQDLRQEFIIDSNNSIIIQKPTEGDLDSWIKELDSQTFILEKKLELIQTKQKVMVSQRGVPEQNISKDTAPSAITLKKEINLKHLEVIGKQIFESEANINKALYLINPQNAILVHFNNNWEEVPTVTTNDGCILVPNAGGRIGLSEIECGFKVMPGIDKKIIPESWIKNQYKWIIWKLASYERYFPSALGGCFNIDNVIKQLKYKYIRELYNAERPALRKIFEMDDVSQKRMVLCVSNILKNGDHTELELTDGWYSIKTTIDEPLCYQVEKQMIVIGTKLIMSGSELLYCEGCHPLEFEAASRVRMKIHFNCTRRAAWHVKLGYQKNSLPFRLPLSSLHVSGGPIGCIQLFIIRIYPLDYMEKVDDITIWRNQKSEIRRAQEFENEQFRQHDSQQYSQNLEKQKHVPVANRYVVPVLNMTVLDAYENTGKPFKFSIWKPSNHHLEELRENDVFLFYNTLFRSNGDLYSTRKTYFKKMKDEFETFHKYRRKMLLIDDDRSMFSNIVLDEFDTVGVIVEFEVNEHKQDLWLVHTKNRLLHITVNEGPKTCLLLNGLEKGHSVAISNVVIQKCTNEYVNAVANHYSIITRYPQAHHLQDGLKSLEALDSQELLSLLKKGKEKLNKIKHGSECLKFNIRKASSQDESTLNFSKITSTDIAMSMIDIDQYIDKGGID